MAKEEPLDLSGMLKELQEGIRKSIYSPNINSYVPHAKQQLFHGSDAKGRLYIGGNRGGKTVGGATESIWWLTHKHPYLSTPTEPVRGRCVSVDFVNGVEAITKPEIKKWLPPSELIEGSWEASYNSNTRTLTLANGSFLEFKSYDQDLDKHAGTSRHFVWFDEEPPHSIFDENMMRLIDTNGKWWLTMTPVEGATWTLDEIYEPAMEGKRNVFVVEVNTQENPHLNHDAMSELMEFLADTDRKARQEGKFTPSAGLVFPNYSYQKHIISKVPFDLRNPKIRIYASMDLGINNPTAWLWHAVTPDGRVITFKEFVVTDMTIPQISKEVKKIEKELGVRPELRVGDPSIKQRSAQTGLSNQIAYSQNGIYIALGNNDLSGLDKMRDYLDERKWLIHESCIHTIKEIKKYRWKEWDSRKLRDKNNKKDEPHKKDDHCMDSARYMFSFLPELRKESKDDSHARLERARETVRNMLDGVPTQASLETGFYDERFIRPKKQTEWVAIDETLGGIW